ncbi:hypothetical protein D1AOALGA4SA_4249 [Olavius algarvensis Delta 1 endosymbiont]|nr:hypothetical protein D1AOALGA4SA_4249 [Olavius algarvensis Delta 1 endosymbiont]
MMESLRSVVLNRPFGKKAHDRQNTLFDAYSPPSEDSMLGVRCLQSAYGGFDVGRYLVSFRNYRACA